LVAFPTWPGSLRRNRLSWATLYSCSTSLFGPRTHPTRLRRDDVWLAAAHSALSHVACIRARSPASRASQAREERAFFPHRASLAGGLVFASGRTWLEGCFRHPIMRSLSLHSWLRGMQRTKGAYKPKIFLLTPVTSNL
jgi:hypothetical protein